jgi:hypothetical protein
MGRKLKLQIQMSVDGFIAGLNDKRKWIQLGQPIKGLCQTIN